MSDGLEHRAARLREAFDRSFAERLERAAVPTTDLLGVRVAGEPYAVRLSQVASLHVDRALTPLPSGARFVAGLVSLRGALHTVFDLRAVLGKQTGLAARWLIALKDHGAAFAFDGFDGLLRVETASIAPAATREPLVDEVWLGPVRRPVLNLRKERVVNGP